MVVPFCLRTHPIPSPSLQFGIYACNCGLSSVDMPCGNGLVDPQEVGVYSRFLWRMEEA
jgi:hypothetical protein